MLNSQFTPGAFFRKCALSAAPTVSSTAALRRLSGVGICIALTGLLGACSDSDDSAGDDITGEYAALGTCPFPTPPGVRVTCGMLTVPENYAKPKGSQIELF